MPRKTSALPADVVDDLSVRYPKLIPIAVAAPMSGYSKPSFYRFAAEGKITLTKRGSRTYVSEDELARFIETQTRTFRPGEVTIAAAGGRLRRDA